MRLGYVAAALLVYAICFHNTEFNLSSLRSGIPALGDLFAKMLPPEFGYLPHLIKPTIETIQVGIISTLISGALALPVAFLAARNLSPSRYVLYPVRFILTVFRGVSELIWALIFVVAVGLGPFAGILAIVIFGLGAQAKLLSEAIEATDAGPIEALTAAGVPRWKAFLFAACPGVWPQYVAQCLHFWDHNTRAAAILGFVGGGGLGYNLLQAIGSYQYRKAAVAIILLVGIISVIDRASLYLRRRIV
ncbi:MAG TPA: phosphonate ABC transporter, permease protein PhnE [Beijerinckiaceae bacterium]|nr:phosphonate ABC transporter, permease protein PhnE [Beijerinckiaceae bacterium]